MTPGGLRRFLGQLVRAGLAARLLQAAELLPRGSHLLVPRARPPGRCPAGVGGELVPGAPVKQAPPAFGVRPPHCAAERPAVPRLTPVSVNCGTLFFVAVLTGPHRSAPRVIKA